MHSVANPICNIQFPEYTGRQIYMLEATLNTLRDLALGAYETVVERMFRKSGMPADTKFYITVDEREVQAGEAHRRGGAHIDGNFLFGWGGGGNGWLNGVPGRVLTPEQHRLQYQSPLGATLIASNYPGCDVWVGHYKGIPGQGGDCEHLREEMADMTKVRLEPNMIYLMNSGCIHQSVPVDRTVHRQLVRLTLDNTVLIH
jgi:hypothetical protein